MRHTRLKITTKEENVAVRLSGKVKNFTGKTPGVIKVKINDSLVNVQFKWFLSSTEKSILRNFQDQTVVNAMRNQWIEVAQGRLLQALSEVFDQEVKVLEIKEESLQEKLNIQVRLLGTAS